MPLTLNVGFNQKLGQPDYGSVGASCHVECELDSHLLFHDPAAFQKQVHDIYQACTQAVHDELSRHQPAANGNGHSTHSNGQAATNGNSNSNGHSRSQSSGRRQATQSQVKAINSIAQRQRVDLLGLLLNRFGQNRPEDLSLAEASKLIDELKAPANGAGGSR